MADNIRIDITARDYATSVFRSVTGAVNGFASNTNNAVSRFNSSLRGYNNAMRGFNTAVRNTLVDAGRSIYNFTTDAIRSFAELELQHSKTMGAIQANYGKTIAEQERFMQDSAKLKEQAITLGTVGPTGQGSLANVTDVSLAQTALVKSGVTPEQVLNTNALQAVMKFAGGNDLGMEEAASFGIQLSTMFGKSIEEWETMFDQITYAADISPVDVEDIMASLVRGGGLPGSMGRPLEEVLTALSVMGYSGLKGGMAGTALQTFYSRGINPTGVTTAGPAPTQNVEDLYNSVTDIVVDDAGNFTGMESFLEGISGYTDDLNDQEYAWFARKLFGMFQQKAMYALGKENENGDLLYSDVQQGITQNAAGTTDAKWDIMLDSGYGDIERVKNAWAGFKADVGDRLSPAISEFSNQIFGALTTGDFEFNFENLRKAIYDSGDLIAEKYGDQIGELVKGLGDFVLDAVQIGGAVAPTVGGIGLGILELFSGDFQGAWEAFSNGLDLSNEQIDKLPPELQDMAKGVRNVIIALAALSAINFGTKIMEGISTIWKYTGGKVVSALTRVTSTTTSVTGTSTMVNSTHTTVNAGATTMTTGTTTATVATMTATTPLMNVTATVVNVFGGGGMNPGNGGSGGGSLPPGTGGGTPMLPPGGTPMLPSGGSIPMLPSGGWTPMLPIPIPLPPSSYFPPTIPALPAPAPQLALPPAYVPPALPPAGGLPPAALPGAAGAGAAGAAGAGGASGLTLLRGLGLAGAFLTLLTLSGDSIQTDSVFDGNLKGAIGNDDIITDAQMRQYLIDKQYGVPDSYPEYSSKYTGETYNAGNAAFAMQRYDQIIENMATISSSDGLQKIYDAIAQQISSGEALDEGFFRDLLGPVGNQDIMKELMNTLFPGGNYSNPWIHSGSFADQSLSKHIKGQMDAGNVVDFSQFPTMNELLPLFDQAAQTATDELNNLSVASISLRDAISMLSPEAKLNLGLGPVSDDGLYNKVMGMINNPSAMAANTELLNNVASAIREIEIANSITVDMPRPSINVDVNVRVDPQGGVTKSVIPNYSGFDSFLYQQTQRYGSQAR